MSRTLTTDEMLRGVTLWQPDPGRNGEIVSRAIEGESFAAIARDFDMGRERVRQIVAAAGADGLAKERRHERAVQRETARNARAPRYCLVCDRPCRIKFCSDEHRLQYTYQHRAVNPDGTTSDRQRLENARSILRHPEKRKPSQIAWAERMVAADIRGEPLPPPNRKMRTWSRYSPTRSES